MLKEIIIEWIFGIWVNGCHDLMLKAMSFNNIAIVYVKGNYYKMNFLVYE